MSVRFDEPLWLLVGLLAIPAVVIAVRWFRGMSRWRAWSCGLLRGSLFVVIAGALAGASAVRTSDRLAVIAVVDVSGSLRREAAGDAIERSRVWIEALHESMRPDDSLGVAVFAQRAVAATAPTRGGFEADDVTLDLDLGPATDLAGAIELAAAMSPPDARTRLVVFSDGVETTGDALATAAGLAPLRIDVVPIEYRVPSDVIVEYVDAPPQAAAGASVQVRVALRSSSAVEGTLLLRTGGDWIDLNENEGLGLRVSLEPGLNVRLLTIPLGDRAVHRLEAVFQADDESADAVATNNSAGAVVITPGRGRALQIDGAARGGSALAGVLRDAGFDVTIVSPGEAPTGLLELQAYDLVVLQDVAADETPRATHAALADFVQQLGGGLIVVGGPDALGAGGWNGTALEAALPVKLDLPEELIVPSAAIVMVLDSSGSMASRVMGGSKSQQEIANESAALAAQTLDRSDLVGAIGFSNQPYTVLPLGPNLDPARNGQKIRAIASGGGTNMYPAIETAGDWLRGVEAEVKHVIVLSDGQSMGDPSQGVLAAERMRDDGITVTTIAVGDGADVRTLDSISRAGGGQFYEVMNPNVLPRIFIREIRIIRKPLVREEDFSPVVLASGSSVTAGLRTPPALGGLVLTQARPEPEITLAMVAPSGEPLLAHWNTGLGRVVVFTSDADRWASRWLNWPGYRAMWTQAARYAARPPMSRDAELSVAQVGDALDLRLDAADDDGHPLNLLSVPVIVYAPDGTTSTVQLAQTGPGLYEARVPATESGAYVVAAMPKQGERALAPALVGVSKSAGLELRSLESNAAHLGQIAAATGGRVYSIDDLAPVSEVWDRTDLEAVESAMPLWPVLLLWALGVYVLDIASRRVAWDRLLSREFATARRLSEASAPAAVTSAWKTAKARSKRDGPAGTVGGPEGERAKSRRVSEAVELAAEVPKKVRESDEESRAEASEEPRSGLLAAKRRASQRFESDDDLSGL